MKRRISVSPGQILVSRYRDAYLVLLSELDQGLHLVRQDADSHASVLVRQKGLKAHRKEVSPDRPERSPDIDRERPTLIL